MMAGYKLLSEPPKGTDATSQMKNYQFLQSLPPQDREAFQSILTSNSGSLPAAIQEYNFYSQLDEAGKANFLRVKRADMNLNLGGTQAVRSPAGGIIERYAVTPKPEDQPVFKAAQTAAVDTAKAQVERDVNAPKLKSKIASQEAKLKNLEKTIDNAIKNSGFWSTGIMAQMTSGVGGTPAKNLAATLDTVKANMGFDELQEMRDNSPTGGALGQVAVQEIQYLQSVIASLDQAQSNEQLKRNLETIKAAKRDSNKRIRDAYEQTYGTQQGKPPISDLWGN
jgi:hypothetical protein